MDSSFKFEISWTLTDVNWTVLSLPVIRVDHVVWPRQRAASTDVTGTGTSSLGRPVSAFYSLQMKKWIMLPMAMATLDVGLTTL